MLLAIPGQKATTLRRIFHADMVSGVGFADDVLQWRQACSAFKCRYLSVFGEPRDSAQGGPVKAFQIPDVRGRERVYGCTVQDLADGHSLGEGTTCLLSRSPVFVRESTYRVQHGWPCLSEATYPLLWAVAAGYRQAKNFDLSVFGLYGVRSNVERDTHVGVGAMLSIYTDKFCFVWSELQSYFLKRGL